MTATAIVATGMGMITGMNTGTIMAMPNMSMPIMTMEQNRLRSAFPRCGQNGQIHRACP